MPTVPVNGTTLFYDQVGEGPVCLVMHGGLGYDHSYFRPALDRLAGRLRLVYYDHRGNGRSGLPPAQTLTMEQLADDAAGLASHVGADSVLAFGHSFGGFVAQELAVRHPGRVAGLILAGTTPGQLGESEAPEEAGGPPPPPALVEALQSLPETDDEFAAMSPSIVRHYFHRLQPAALEAVFASTIYSAAAARRGMELLREWSSVDRLGRVRAPALLLVGSHDVACSPSQSYRIARHLPGAEVVELEESGHFPWLEEPERFFGAVEGWLDRLGLTAGGRPVSRD